METITTYGKTITMILKKLSMSVLLFLFCINFGLLQSTFAQTFIDVEPDAPGQVGSLVSAVEEHGADDVIFRLERGEVYWVDANIANIGYHLHIEAAEGDGPPPMIRPAVDLDGTSDHPIHAEGDLTLKGIYYGGLDDVGRWMGNTRLRTENTRMELDNMHFDFHTCFLLRSDADNTSYFVTNSMFRHVGQLTDPNCGRVFDSRGNNTDSLSFVNNTMYLGTHFVIRPHTGTVNYLKFDHNTVVDWGRHIEIGYAKEVEFTNNLIINVGFRGNEVPEEGFSDESLLTFTSAEFVEAYNDEDRSIIIKNNNMGTMRQEYEDVLLEHFDAEDPHRPFIHDQLIDSVGQDLMDMGVLIMENNIMETENEGIQFTSRPDFESVVEYVAAYATNPDGDLPALWDRRDNLSVGVDQWRDFSYNMDAESYTAAEHGLPLGDLNWFPEKKEEWEQIATSVEDLEERVHEFRLLGNYPNPFNPTTNIQYQLSESSKVVLEVYNVLGQRVSRMNMGTQVAGDYSVEFDASQLSSGFYLVRMYAGNNIQSIKMTLLK